jgi:hypothetical protein
MRERAGSCVVAVARDDAGQPLRTVTLTGVDPYSFTARFLAWAAVTAADPGVDGVGALGPVEAFGLVRLMQGVRQCGLDPLTGD